VSFYEDFLDFCHHVVASGGVPAETGAEGMPLRTLDRALRQWSENRQEEMREQTSEPAVV
jgi:hypothetical protein